METIMRRLAAIGSGLFCLGTSSIALAQQAPNTTPLFSSGPTIQAFKIYQPRTASGTEDWTVGVLAAGAGYSFNFNVLCPCQTSWLTVGLPIYLSYASQTQNFTFGPALSVGTFNNLISLAVGYSMFDIEQNLPSLGWALGKFDKSLAFYTINLGFNLGSGSPPAGGGGTGTPPTPAPAGPPPAQSPTPPTNFVRLW
jgi:hypothetical protein